MFDTKYHTKLLHLKVNAQEHHYLYNACDTKYVQKHYFDRQMLRKSSLENVFDTKYVQNFYFEGKWQVNHYCKLYFTTNMYKIIALKANAKEMVTWKCIWQQIHTKLSLLKPNPQKIITLICIWHNICTK